MRRLRTNALDKMTIHGAAVAKIHAMRRKLLSPKDFDELLDSDEPIELLKDKLFLNQELRTLSAVEQRLQRRAQRSIVKIYHYYHLAYRKFFRAILMRYEIEWIKGAVRRIENNEDVPLLKRTLLPTILDHFDPEKLAQAKDLSSLMDSIIYPPYRKVLGALDELEHSRIFHIEMSLDKLYFKAISDGMKRLNAQDRTIVESIAGFNIDLLNLNWILRAKEIYNISAEEIFNYTLYKGQRYSMNDLKRLSYLSVEELKEEIERSPYHEIFSGIPINRELRIEAAVYTLIKPFEIRFPHSIAALMSFLHDMEYQMQDVSMILEAHDYGIDVRELLIGRKVKGGSRKN